MIDNKTAGGNSIFQVAANRFYNRHLILTIERLKTVIFWLVISTRGGQLVDPYREQSLKLFLLEVPHG